MKGNCNLTFWAALLLLLSAGRAVSADQGPVRKVPPLADSRGSERLVRDSAELQNALENTGENVTILIADGTYKIERPIYMQGRKNVTVRSASADPSKVVLRGRGWDSKDKYDDILRIGNCENITVAHISFTDCHAYALKVEAENHPKNIAIYNCHFRDIGTRAIKGSGGRGSAQHGSIQYCHFENTKTPPEDWLYEGNYISAIDMMALDDWTISDNVLKNIKGRSGGARAAIFVWVLSKNVRIERNLIVDCDRGIALGNPSASTAQVAAGEFHVRNAVCRNNFIVPGPDAGIELWWVDGARVYHNTIWRRDESGRGIRCGSRIRNVHVANNLVRGAISREGNDSGPDVRLENNVAGSLDGYFVDPGAGDLRLTKVATAARDAAIPLPQVADDFYARARDSRPDIGAAEFIAAQP